MGYEMEMAGRVFLKMAGCYLLVGFPDIKFGFGTHVRSLPDALRIATPKKRLPGAGGGFLTSEPKVLGKVTIVVRVTIHIHLHLEEGHDIGVI